MSETLGFIGLGNMGLPIAANLIRAGYSLRVFNRTAARAEPLVKEGAVLVPRAADAAVPGGIVLTMLADDGAEESVALREDGFADRLGPGGIHAALSTISPATSRRLAGQHARSGNAYVAAPVFGRPEAAATAKLWVCLSGPAEAKQRLAAVVKAISQGSFDFGEDAGAANVVKLCGNFLIAAAMESMAEAFTLAKKNQLDEVYVADALTRMLFPCPIYQGYGSRIAQWQFEPVGFRLGLGLKDIRLVLETGTQSETPLPLASLLRDRWLTAVARGRADMDWSAAVLGAAEDAGLAPAENP